MLRSRYARVALFLGVVAAVQLATQASDKAFFLTQLTMAAYYTLVAAGLSLLMGYAGQISLGHAAFFAIGGYASASLTTLDLSAERAAPAVALLARLHVLVPRADLYGGEALSFHPWAAFVAAVAIALAVAWLIGVPVLKLKGHYLAMATLGFGTIVYSVLLASQRLGAADGLGSRRSRSSAGSPSGAGGTSASRTTTWPGGSSRSRSSCSRTSSSRGWGGRSAPSTARRTPPRRWASTSRATSSAPSCSPRRSRRWGAPSSPTSTPASARARRGR